MGLTIYRKGEQELIQGCRRGDRIAQKQLYETYSPKMYGLCCRYLKDPMHAEDALVTAFTRILEKIEQFKGDGSLENWIKVIVIREALAVIRKNQLQRNETDLEAIENRAAGIQDFGDPFDTEELLCMIQDLPEGYRTVFNLYAIEGYSHMEIAEKLSISENTSKSQLSRARAFLQRKLAQFDKMQNIKRNDITAR